MRLLEILLKYNIFEFSDTIWQQLIGVSMGVQPAPSIANIFMGRNVDKKMKKLGEMFIMFMKMQ